MSRPGKNAQLPHDVRRRLNGRLRNGEPDVRAVLASRFAGRPITKQNLTVQTMATLGEPKARTAPAAGPEPSQTKSK